MSLTKLSLAGNILIIPGPGRVWVSDIPAGDGKTLTFFTVYVIDGGRFWYIFKGITSMDFFQIFLWLLCRSI
jgi:hypothetical protein